MTQQPPKAIPPDYDTDPERSRTGGLAVEKYGLVGDVHEPVADRLVKEGLEPVLDIGCGRGRLLHLLRGRGMEVVGLDSSPTMLAAIPEPRVLADARSLPFPDGSFASAAALYMLYHLPTPEEVIAEAHRVLRPGGLFVACAPSRYDDPELRGVLPPSLPSTFDAEDAPSMVREIFGNVEVDKWDGPFMRLPDLEAVTLYFVGRGVPKTTAERAARDVEVPMTVTKRGAVVYAYKHSRPASQ